ncbi:RNA-dependent RNA polymerase [Grass carp reovirus]|uniref:RNA-directed RNA polymerase n=1 Tax=Grass carp reovirus TaxID=128987 RepID=M1U8T0_GCRV|nr:RNA-dependent RNA polymerase [Grass carp reovirus]
MMDHVYQGLSQSLRDFIPFLRGEKDINDNDFSQASADWHGHQRSYATSLLSKIPFTTCIRVSHEIFVRRDWRKYYRIDESGRVRRVPVIDDEDVFVPNADIRPLLIPMRSQPDYGILHPDIQSGADAGVGSDRMAAAFFKTASSQVRQLKMDVSRPLLALLLAWCSEGSTSRVITDISTSRDIATCPPLHALQQVLSYYTKDNVPLLPTMIVRSGPLWIVPPTGKSIPSHIPLLIADLVNLSILGYVCNIDDELLACGVEVFLAAARSESYSHTLLACKALFPALSLHALYRDGFIGGKVPVMEWAEPRNKYTFKWVGSRVISADILNMPPVDYTDVDRICERYGLGIIKTRIGKHVSACNMHNHASMKLVRDVMALTSGTFIVRSATESVLKEYAQPPLIKQPIRESDWSGYIGNVRYLKATAPGPAQYLWSRWRDAAMRLLASPRLDDPLSQAILRTQYVTARGGSGANMRDALISAGAKLPNYAGVGVKMSTKIVQVAQIADLPFELQAAGVDAAVAMGSRNQVQRRTRVIMPLSPIQQNVSAIHTITADVINKAMNLSTTSGSAVHEKVVPLLMYASIPPNRVINIDIKACDASITPDYFLSVICGAIHHGLSNEAGYSPFMGVPPADVIDATFPTNPGRRRITGKQNMVQHLARLYKKPFQYDVNDPFSPGNKFQFDTTVFPSGSTATSTEHTANNSTMFDYFLTHYVPQNAQSPTLKHIVRGMSIQRNYVCQGDDGICILDHYGGRRVSNEDINEFIKLLIDYGGLFGWRYDIDFHGNAEFLKLCCLLGCRVPNASRHAPVGREHATADASEAWPGMIDIVIGMYVNGISDAYDWRKWLRFTWALLCFVSRASINQLDRRITVQFPVWTFVYLGVPPISAFGSGPYMFSSYMPQGDLGIYSLITLRKEWIMQRCVDLNYSTTHVSRAFGDCDVRKLFAGLGIYAGYYAAQMPRTPPRQRQSTTPEVREEFIGALNRFLFYDRELTRRVERGRMLWDKFGQTIAGKYIRRVPSLRDVPSKWFSDAREADTATQGDIFRLASDLERRFKLHPQHFSDLLEAYLRVEWDAGDVVPPAIDPDVPVVAGIDLTNDDLFFKLVSVGPLMQSVRRYFQQTLFVGKTVSGMDVEHLDATLLRLKILGAPPEAFKGVLQMAGFSDTQANEIYSKVVIADARLVQIARVVNLHVPDKWMLLNFDYLLRDVISHQQLLITDRNSKLPARRPWMRAILKFLGAGVVMTQVGPVRYMYVKQIKGGGAALSNLCEMWMRKV